MTKAIRAEHLSKRYRIGAAQTKFRYGMMREVLVDVAMSPVRFVQGITGKGMRGTGATSYIWALEDVSFDLEEGRVLGIVGRNGAGKSTLLKVLSRVTEPTKGTVMVRGRVGSLLEVGTGFHPELTEREDIYMNGAVLGRHRQERERKFDEIVAFSEVEQFIATPVKRYSSGMYLRLAFAVAAHLEPEILVVDEVLAVGDAEFQRKCLGKMNDVAQQGRTVLFVSHNMSAILRLTQEAIVLKKGQLIKRAPTPEAVDYYLASGQAESGERIWDADEIPAASAPFRPISLRLKDRSGNVVDTIRSTEPVTLEWEYQLEAPLTGLRVGMYLSTMRGEYVLRAFDVDDAGQYEKFGVRKAGRDFRRYCLPADFLNACRSSLGVFASSFGVRRYFMDENALSFSVDVSGGPGTQWPEMRQGPVRPRLDWTIETVD